MYRRFLFVALALPVAMAACASEEGIRLSVTGRVLVSPDDTVGLSGARIEIPAAGVFTISGIDGRFSLSGKVPEVAAGLPNRVAVLFGKVGLADVVHGVTVLPETTATIIAVMTRPSVSPTLAIPNGGTSVAKMADNATFTFRTDSLVDRSGTPLQGDVAVTLAGWDASLPPDPNATPVRYDGLYPPSPIGVLATDGTDPYLRVLAACSFGTESGSPSAETKVGVDLISQYASLAFEGVTETDDRLFLVNDQTGIFEESGVGTVDHGNRIAFGIDRPGTWVWAKAVDDPACVMIDVRIGRRPAPGAHVRLTSVDINHRDESLLDEKIVAKNGVFCLREPSGRAARVTAFVSRTTDVLSASTMVAPSSGGSCDTDCPVFAEIILPCESVTDCDSGEICSEGTCSTAI
jgi:hypothetical protein